jgi:prolipoprotein diacylglyceryltransferase
MDFPVGWQIGPLRVSAHALCEALAYLVGGRLYFAARRRRGDVLDDGTRWTILAAAIAGAALGSRLLYLAGDPLQTVARWRDFAYLAGGKTIVGGLLGGWIAVETTKRLAGVTVATGDLLALPLAVGIAIGRLGCFLAGTTDGTHGSPTGLPWGIDFGDGIRRHPAPFYEMIFLAALAVGLVRRARRPTENGSQFRSFLAAYLGFRLLVDFLKPAPARWLALSAIQWACLAGLLYYATRAAWRRVDDRARERAAPPAAA